MFFLIMSFYRMCPILTFEYCIVYQLTEKQFHRTIHIAVISEINQNHSYTEKEKQKEYRSRKTLGLV